MEIVLQCRTVKAKAFQRNPLLGKRIKIADKEWRYASEAYRNWFVEVSS